MRRGPGIAGLRKQAETTQKFRSTGETVAESQVAEMKRQLEAFRDQLEAFAMKHRSDINKDPQLRFHFQRMCSRIGVDPLAAKKGFWTETLGLGGFYNELGVQAASVCIAAQSQNGGLIELSELWQLLSKKRGRSAATISEDDVERSIKTLAVLGNGYRIVVLGGRKYVQMIPGELSTDECTILGIAANPTAATEGVPPMPGRITVEQLVAVLGWAPVRVETALERLIRDAICWFDEIDKSYWVVSMAVAE